MPMYCSLNAMNPFSSTDLLGRKASGQAECWQDCCLLKGKEPKGAKMFSGMVTGTEEKEGRDRREGGVGKREER